MSTKKTLYLHIGTPKTGSTSIQKYLMDRSETLLGQGLLYPQDERVFWHWGHHPLGAVLTEPFAPWVDSKYDVDPEQIFRVLRNCIQRSKAERIVVSSEQFSLASRLHDVPDLLPGVDLKVICYFRWQADFLVSWFRQSILVGGYFFQPTRENFSEFVRRWDDKLDYFGTAERLAEIFGAENLIIRLFGKEYFKDGDLIHDFLDAVDTPPGLDDADSENAEDADGYATNAACSGDLLELKAHANDESLWDSDLRRLRRFSRDIEGLVQELSGPDTYSSRFASCFDEEMQSELLARFEEGNRQLIEKYLGGGVELPTPRPVDPERETEIDLARIARLLVASWKQQDQRTARLEARIEELEGGHP